jgi:hypothetical protein
MWLRSAPMTGSRCATRVRCWMRWSAPASLCRSVSAAGSTRFPMTVTPACPSTWRATLRRLAEGESFVHESLIGTEFIGRIRGVATVGDKPAVLPTITGKGWITAFHQYVLDPTDPFPLGFRVGDTWPDSA